MSPDVRIDTTRLVSALQRRILRGGRTSHNDRKLEAIRVSIIGEGVTLDDDAFSGDSVSVLTYFEDIRVP